MHPTVASTVNELGNIAVAEDRYDEAVMHFTRMVEIYRTAYGGKHYLIGVALSNLASAYNADKQYAKAEPLFREAIAMYDGDAAAGAHHDRHRAHQAGAHAAPPAALRGGRAGNAGGLRDHQAASDAGQRIPARRTDRSRGDLRHARAA